MFFALASKNSAEFAEVAGSEAALLSVLIIAVASAEVGGRVSASTHVRLVFLLLCVFFCDKSLLHGGPTSRDADEASGESEEELGEEELGEVEGDARLCGEEAEEKLWCVASACGGGASSPGRCTTGAGICRSRSNLAPIRACGAQTAVQAVGGVCTATLMCSR